MLRQSKGIRSIEQNDHVAFVAEADLEHLTRVIQNAQHTDGRRRIDRFAQSFVVKADVSAGDGRAKRNTSFAEPVDSFAKLPHHFSLFRTAEIEAIGRSDGPRAGCSDVARSFRDRVHRANARIELAPAAVAVGGKRQRAFYDVRLWIFDAHDRSIAGARSSKRVG